MTTRQELSPSGVTSHREITWGTARIERDLVGRITYVQAGTEPWMPLPLIKQSPPAGANALTLK